MHKKPTGIIHNAFYLRNTRGNTSNCMYGKTPDPNSEIFEYQETEDGHLVIVEHHFEK